MLYESMLSAPMICILGVRTQLLLYSKASVTSWLMLKASTCTATLLVWSERC